ncbi:MAG: membrane protein insertase YidC [Planctomycetota bacterium]
MPPKKPNTALRLGVPVVLLLVAIGAAWAVLTTSSAPSNPQTATTPSKAAATDESAQIETPAASDETIAEAQPETPAEPEPQAEPAADVEDETGVAETEPPAADPEPVVVLRARTLDSTAAFTPIGGIDPDGPAALRLEFSRIGAGVASLRLASEFQQVEQRTEWKATGDVKLEDHVELQAEQTQAGSVVTPFAALWAEVDGLIVGLTGNVWRETAPGTFEAVIEDADGSEQLRVTRSYVVPDGSLDVLVSQRIQNLTDTPRRVRLVTFGPIDLPKGEVTYGGDRRRIRFGYLKSPQLDPARNVVLAEKFLSPRTNFLGPRDESGWYVPAREVWPNEDSISAQLSLVWAGMTNRYYSVVVHGQTPETTTDRTFTAVERVERVVLQNRVAEKESTLILRLASPVIELAGNAATNDASYRFYAGPKHEPTIAEQPDAEKAGIESVVAYNFGGPCAACTFTWLTGPLLGALRFFHGIVPDWSIAIVMLVLLVRGILHPVNRWSQIRVQRFGKQMQDLAPKQKKIQEKYRDDRQRMQQEMAKLWREEGVNPSGMLGCLPMLLQSPIWIALYASLFYFYDLRHEPAFFGAIQTVTGGNWLFLADLAEPDTFITLPQAIRFSIPLMGEIQGFNILPIVLGVVYFIHMKFMTPPTSTTLSPEQEQTQKIAKYMTVILFPVIMYNAPSGLALYFISNSTLAILENTWIRAHVKKHDLLEVKKKPKKARKKGGFMDRLQQIAEQQQALREQQKQARSGGVPVSKGGKGESAAQRAIRKSRDKNGG